MKSKVTKTLGLVCNLERHHDLVIKKLYVKPFKKISLQKHFKRDEFWYVFWEGVHIDNEHRLASSGLV